VEAWGDFTVSGEPDKVGQSDLLNAMKKVISDITGFGEMDERITANANNIIDIFKSVDDHEKRLDTLEPAVSQHGQNISNNTGKINVLQQTLATLNWLLSIGPPPLDGKTYGFRNRAYYTAGEGGGGGIALGDAILALKFYSKKTIMVTNARIVNRRQRRWDIGLPYLSASSEVYHFDTDTNNVDQASSITIGYTGEAPALVGAEDNNGQIYLAPAVLDMPPYEMIGRSLYGHFSISAQLPKNGSTAEFWVRLIQTQNIVILRAGLSAEDEIALNIGGSDPAYSAPGDDAVAYSLPESDGVAYSTASTTGNRLDHTWPAGSESVDLDAEGIAITQNTWTHLAVVSTAENISVYINKSRVDFDKHVQTEGNMNLEINEDQDEFNVDELTLDRTMPAAFDGFSANSDARIPYAALDYQEKWMVLMAEDPDKVKTNLFETEQFRDAVHAVINQG
jgi:hypothetical protein